MNGLLEKFGIDLPEPLTGFLPFAIAVGIAFYLIIYRTRFGFDLRTSGKNPNAARSSGVNPKAMILKTMILSGVIAGLAGMSPLMTEFCKYGDTFPTRHRLHGHRRGPARAQQPGGIAIAAIVWAGIERASQNLELRRRAPGDRPDPPGHAAALGRHRLRGRPSLSPDAGGEGGRRQDGRRTGRSLPSGAVS